MQTAGARALREHETEDLSREAVLLQWERKIEAAERRPSRFEEHEGEGGTVAELRPTEDATHEEPRRFERRAAELLGEQLSGAPSRSPASPLRPAGGASPSWRARSPSPSGSASGPSCSACS
jgi:hypothetical protein